MGCTYKPYNIVIPNDTWYNLYNTLWTLSRPYGFDHFRKTSATVLLLIGYWLDRF